MFDFKRVLERQNILVEVLSLEGLLWRYWFDLINFQKVLDQTLEGNNFSLMFLLLSTLLCPEFPVEPL